MRGFKITVFGIITVSLDVTISKVFVFLEVSVRFCRVFNHMQRDFHAHPQYRKNS